MSKVETIAAGPAVSTTGKTNYAPQFFVFKVGTIPTNVKINIEGTGVTYDLSSAGLRGLQAAIGYSKDPDVYVIPVASGFVKQRNCQITIENADAAEFELYSVSDRYPTPGEDLAYFQAITQNVNANSGTLIDKFTFLAMPSAAADDNIIVNYRTGFQETHYRESLQAIHHLKSADNLTTDAANYIVNNLDRSVSSVNYTPSTQQDIFVFRYAPAKGVNTVA